MAYIYKITNDINDKVYIGKTLNSIEERFMQHKKDSNRSRNRRRPLYDAMNKYGTEAFHIELVEEVSHSEADSREIYWIERYDSFGSSGYNATRGGDGAGYVDYDMITDMYRDGYNMKEIQCITGHDKATIRIALEEAGICEEERIARGRLAFSTSVAQLDKETGKIIDIFSSITEACKAVGQSRNNGAISLVCNGKRQSAYGFKWKFWEM